MEDGWESGATSSTIPEHFALPTSMPGVAPPIHPRQAASVATPSKPVDRDSCDIMWVPTSSEDFPQMACMAEALLIRRSPHLRDTILEHRRDLILRANASVGADALAHATSYYEREDLGFKHSPLDTVIDHAKKHLEVRKQRCNLDSVSPHGWSAGNTLGSKRPSVLSPSRLGPADPFCPPEPKRLVLGLESPSTDDGDHRQSTTRDTSSDETSRKRSCSPAAPSVSGRQEHTKLSRKAASKTDGQSEPRAAHSHLQRSTVTQEGRDGGVRRRGNDMRLQANGPRSGFTATSTFARSNDNVRVKLEGTERTCKLARSVSYTHLTLPTILLV